MTGMAGAGEVDAYLSGVEPAKRAALATLRAQLHAAAPGSEEVMRYGMPHLRRDGMMVAAFAAAKNHCGLYPCSAATVETFKADLADFTTSKGAIRFTPDHPIPEALVRRLVEARLSENAQIAAERAARKAAKRKRAPAA